MTTPRPIQSRSLRITTPSRNRQFLVRKGLASWVPIRTTLSDVIREAGLL